MSEEGAASGDATAEGTGARPLYVAGVPNHDRMGFVSISMGGLGAGPMGGVEAVARTLNRPVEFVDDEGYERAILAGTVDADRRRMAWVECKSKELEGGWVDVEFRLKASEDGRPVIDWVVETYNPYFGCRVGHLAWLNQRVLVVYREKHDTYACTLGTDGSVRREKIAGLWRVAEDQITYVSDRPDIVERLSLPDLSKLEAVSGDKARSEAILPPGFDEWQVILRERANRRKSHPTPREGWGIGWIEFVVLATIGGFCGLIARSCH